MIIQRVTISAKAEPCSLIDRLTVHHHTKTLKAWQICGRFTYGENECSQSTQAAQWEQVSPAFRGLVVGTVEMAKAVLVDGVRPSDLARQSDVSRQLVYAAVQTRKF